MTSPVRFARPARPLAAGALLALAALAGCARTSVEQARMQAPPGLPRPSAVVVFDFTVSPSEVVLDSGVVDKLIADAGMPVMRPPATPSSGPFVTVEGQFVEIKEGNATRRLLIGLGVGASEVRTLVQGYQQTPDGRQLVDDFYATAKSSRKPGMAEAMGVGAVAGTLATATALSGAVGGATTRSQTAQADGEAAAKTISKQIPKLFADHGWIAEKR